MYHKRNYFQSSIIIPWLKIKHIERYVDHKYVVEIHDLEFHGNLLNGHNCFGTHILHVVNTPTVQMQGHNTLNIIPSLLSSCKQIKKLLLHSFFSVIYFWIRTLFSETSFLNRLTPWNTYLHLEKNQSREEEMTLTPEDKARAGVISHQQRGMTSNWSNSQPGCLTALSYVSLSRVSGWQ